MRLTADLPHEPDMYLSGCREQPGKRVGGVPYIGTGSLLHCNTGAWFLQWFYKNILCLICGDGGSGHAPGHLAVALRQGLHHLSP